MISLSRSTALFLIASALLFLPLAFFYDGGLYLYSPVKAALLASLGIVLLFLLFAERWASAQNLFPADAAEWLLAFFLFWMGLSAALAINPWVAGVAWLQWAAAIAAFWFVRRSDVKDGIAGALLAGAVFTALIGYAQARGYGPPRSADQYGEVLLTGTFGQANFAAQAVVPAVAGGFALMIAASGAAGIVAGAILSAVALPYLILTGSRGALLSTAAAIALLLGASFLRRAWNRRRRVALLAGFLLAASIAAWVALPGARKNVADAFNPGSQSTGIRMAIWRDSFPLLFRVPLLGFGPNQFLFHFPEHWSEDTAKRVFTGGSHLVENPHNDWIAVGLDGGLPALLALGLFVFGLMAGTWRTAWARQAPPPLMLAGFAVALTWALYGLVDYPLHNPVPLFGFFTALGLLRPITPADEAGSGSRSLGALLLATGCLVLGISVIPQLIRSVPSQALALKASQHLAIGPIEASRLALEAIELDPHNALAFAVLGQAKLLPGDPKEKKDYDGAENLLRQALQLYPDDFVARYNLAVALYEEAIERDRSFEIPRRELKRVLDINPYYGKAYFQLASMDAREASEGQVIRRNLDRAIKLEPPLLLTAMRAPEFEPYRTESWWAPWSEGLRTRLNVRQTK